MVPPSEDLHQRIASLEQRLRRTQRCTGAFAVLAGVLALAAFQVAPQKQRFTEIDVERINVLEPNGMPALIIANSARLPGGIVEGKEIIQHRPPVAGMLFYNSEGTEAGGLIYNGRRTGETASAGMSLTFDQLNQDQVIQVLYSDNGQRRTAGLIFTDRPANVHIRDQIEQQLALKHATAAERARIQEEMRAAGERGEFGTRRVFLGTRDRTAAVRLHDTAGRERIRLYVDSANVARMEFLDEVGQVIHAFPKP